jgi:phospholipase/carboxylesterase
MGALRYFRRTGEGVYDMADLDRRTEAMAGFIDAEKTRIGATRTVGLGYSNGANILSAVAFRHPGLVDDLVLLHPLIPWEPAPQPGVAGRRVLITAGRRDPICPAPLTERLAAWFEAQGAEVTLAWHPGGHEIAQAEIAAIQQFLATVAA